MKKIGIRRENKGPFEKRSPIVPNDVKKLIESGLKVFVEKSRDRIIPVEEYEKVGAESVDNFTGIEADLILGIKEVKPEYLLEEKVYMFFAHVIKGQKYNMEMLKEILKKNITLIDYETIKDDQGKRLIFFGRYAGLAGAIDTLWALGKRLSYEGISTPFRNIKRALEYKDLEEVKNDVKLAGEAIKKDGLPEIISPLTVAFTGYGNVSSGAQEIFDLLPVVSISPEELLKLSSADYSRRNVYKTVFREEDLFVRKDPKIKFDLNHYYENPGQYECVFEKYSGEISVLVNGSYWDDRYPRTFTSENAKRLWKSGSRKLKVIGDVSCDIAGGVEITVKTTGPGDPVFVYNPSDGNISDGIEGEGIVILAVDILPSELPLESSNFFSRVLMKFIPEIAEADFNLPFENLELPGEIKNAVITHRGRLTPNYLYLQNHLK
ncbi:hypothetical protein JXL83_03575 [candidate division WOR-3 bacterium]|nr:hypothetical protein [candidate division WOR-3 bacterium]